MRQSSAADSLRARVARGGARGFTLVELCMGLLVTSLVMSALAAFTLAMARGWEQSEQVQSISVRARQASGRLTRAAQDARLLGAFHAGSITTNPLTPAAVILWVKDLNDDGSIQGAECAMFEHDAVNRTLHYYPAGQGDTTIVLDWSVFTSPAILANFKGGRTSHVVARGVARARFAVHHASDPARNPTFEFTLQFKDTPPAHSGRPAQELLEYGTGVVRAPARQPA